MPTQIVGNIFSFSGSHTPSCVLFILHVMNENGKHFFKMFLNLGSPLLNLKFSPRTPYSQLKRPEYFLKNHFCDDQFIFPGCS